MSDLFSFDSFEWDAQSGTLCLNYMCQNYGFTEKIIFPHAPFVLSKEQQVALNQIFFLLHIAAGISYYKAFKNPLIKIKSGFLSKKQAAFFNDFYYYGLGQYAAENNLKLNFDFPYSELETRSFCLNLADEAFIPVGGGKDSCVSICRLKKAGKLATLFSVNTARPISDCKEVSKLPQITVRRIISPVLLENNHLFLNGHVPISGIIAFITAVSCVLYNKRYVVMSCEGSADEANFDDVNHQWSKSSVFEKMFGELMHSIIPEYRYFSLLRPMSEMQIASQFAEYCSDYFDVFTSCNHAFHIDECKRLNRWCGVCDKCRFVFLILAPFMDKNKLMEIVGRNPLNDVSQEEGYLQLLGIGQNKPFECVGTYDECRLALLMLSEKDEWQKDILVKKLLPFMNGLSKEDLQKKVWAKGNDTLIPEEFKNV